ATAPSMIRRPTPGQRKRPGNLRQARINGKASSVNCGNSPPTPSRSHSGAPSTHSCGRREMVRQKTSSAIPRSKSRRVQLRGGGGGEEDSAVAERVLLKKQWTGFSPRTLFLSDVT